MRRKTKTKKKISTKDWIRFWISFMKEEGGIFLITALMAAFCVASIAVPFLPHVLKEEPPTPYDELYETTVQGSSVIYVPLGSGRGYYSFTAETGEEFTIQAKYFREYLQDHSIETLEKKLEKLLVSGKEVNIKYDIDGRKIARELRVGDVEVVTYQSEPDEDISGVVLFILCIPLGLLFFGLSVLAVRDCRKTIRDELSHFRARY